MKKKKSENKISDLPEAEIMTQSIDQTIEKNFMPYAMSVIVARAIPDIDGFKPSHRKLLYTMYDMGLMTKPRTKSANVVGQTMHLNPHGDAAIYETLVRLTRGNETLIHPFIDSKGSFGKHYSSDMEHAASRYTEVKLDPFCEEIFSGINKNAVDMVDNYDGTMKEPTLLPTSFPNILVSPNKGIAVAMSSSICSFNLSEVCDGTIQMLYNPDTTVDQILDIIKAPDFQGGGQLIYNRETLREIYRTGNGSIKLRSKYEYNKQDNTIEVLQIPYSSSIETIIKELIGLVKEGKLKEVTDIRNEIDKDGFKLAIDIKRGVDPDKLMTKLYKLTSLQKGFDCNFTVLIDGTPKLLGVCDIIKEWIKFRLKCITREFEFDLNKKNEKLHLLLGLGIILLDLDKAISIVRDTEKDSEVVPNLMSGFNIDEAQAEYIAEIKLRHLNREYILNRLDEIDQLQKDVADLSDLIYSEKRKKKYIIEQLKEIKKKYAKDRQTELIYDEDIVEYKEEDYIESVNVKVFITDHGYLKVIPLTSLRASDVQKLKEDDEIKDTYETTNIDGTIIAFSDQGQMYNSKISDFSMCKASELGDYVPAKLSFGPDEKLKQLIFLTKDETFLGHEMVFIFENGKGVRVPTDTYETKSSRKKLTGAYSTKFPIAGIVFVDKPKDIYISTANGKSYVVNSSVITPKASRTSIGAQIMPVKKNDRIFKVSDKKDEYVNYKRIKLKAAPVPEKETSSDDGDQITFDL